MKGVYNNGHKQKPGVVLKYGNGEGGLVTSSNPSHSICEGGTKGKGSIFRGHEIKAG